MVGSPVTRQEKGREEVVRGDKLGCSHRTQQQLGPKPWRPGKGQRSTEGTKGAWEACGPAQKPLGSSEPLSAFPTGLYEITQTRHTASPKVVTLKNTNNTNLVRGRMSEPVRICRDLSQFSLWPLQSAGTPSIRSWTNGSWILIHSSGLCFLLHAGRPNYSILLFCLFTVCFIYLCLCCLVLEPFFFFFQMLYLFLLLFLFMVKPMVTAMHLSSLPAVLPASLGWSRMLKLCSVHWLQCFQSTLILF